MNNPTNQLKDSLDKEEYEKYCREKYANFFEKLDRICFGKNKTFVYYFNENKELIIKKTNDSLSYFYISDLFPPHTKFYQIDLTIDNYPEKTLPDNLYIENNLILKSSSNVEYFGKNTVIDGSLNAAESRLKSFENIKVKTNVDISETDVDILPNNLYLLGDLNISNTLIETIGENTYIGGNFLAYESNLKYLREDLNLDPSCVHEKRNIKNYIDLRKTKIELIPISFKDRGLNFLIDNIFIKNIDLLVDKRDIIKFSCDNDHNSTNYENNKNGINFYLCGDLHPFHINPKSNFEDSIINLNSYSNLYKNKDEILNDVDIYAKTIIGENNNYKMVLIKNILLYNNFNENLDICEINKQLLLEQFDKIDDLKIRKYIKEENERRINNKITYLENKKENSNNLYNNKPIEKFKLLDYCKNKKILNFIKEKGYIFTDNEYNSIKDIKIKALYEFLLIEQGTKKQNILEDNENNKFILKNKAL